MINRSLEILNGLEDNKNWANIFNWGRNDNDNKSFKRWMVFSWVYLLNSHTQDLMRLIYSINLDTFLFSLFNTELVLKLYRNDTLVNCYFDCSHTYEQKNSCVSSFFSFFLLLLCYLCTSTKNITTKKINFFILRRFICKRVCCINKHKASKKKFQQFFKFHSIITLMVVVVIIIIFIISFK